MNAVFATPSPAMTLSRAQAEDMLIHEAHLLDELKLDEWLTLFTEDGLYWAPIDENDDIATHVSLVYDTPLRREERVYHLLHNEFPAQSPRSRLLHCISNVRVTPSDDSVIVSSSQVVYEMRTGDFAQVGLGDIRPLVARMEHTFRSVDGAFKIACKKILFINRDAWHGNLTFII
ncbi:aromatic-ring-hydroxylating dioxygenase subunit beta [Pigmentiphaga litoralis]|uniref:aromatic-ring-hydroxylating dioxygenase subunit beta n=1 Tax=Pigmentiphaga litoralis TaxID=516702 RepID=UPI003B43C042